MKRLVLSVCLIAGLCLALPAQEASEIIRRADDLMTGDRVYSESEMTVFRSGSPGPTMSVLSYTLTAGGEDRSLTVYKGPARMKGTAYLTIGDDLWVRFGSTGRTRKLSSSAKKNSAGGTDFSYSDMGESSQGLSAKYTVAMSDDSAEIDGMACYEITLRPKPGTEGTYERLAAFIGKDDYRYLTVRYFEAGANIKTLVFSDYENYGGKRYPRKMVMESHTKASRTEVVTTRIEFESPRVKDSFFNTTYLDRIR